MYLTQTHRHSAWRLSIVLSLFVAGCSGEAVDSEHEHSHGVQTIESGVWPPKLNGIEDEQSFSLRRRSAARSTIIEAARAAVMNNRSVRLALGDHYGEFDATLSDDKSSDTASFLFYSHDRNVTIESILEKSGNVRLVETPSTEFQPAENSTEVAQAIDIANESLESAGFSTTGLEGTAMLAHLPAEQVAATGYEFYAERVMYVTFGEGEGELPTFSALVNLNTAVTSDFGPVK